MFRITLKMAWRNALKNKFYFWISLCSLVLGITAFLLISIWAKDELSYDKSFFSASNTYRLESMLRSSDGSMEAVSTNGWPVGKALEANFPEIEKVTYASIARPIIKHKEAYYNENALMADQSFIEVIGLPLLQGNRALALEQPYSVALSKTSAIKYFGNDNPVGKTLFIQDTIPYQVTAVFQDIPEHSHLQFNMLLSFSSKCANDPGFCEEQFSTGWFNLNVYNYVKVSSNANLEKLEAKIRGIVQIYGKNEVEKYGYQSFLSLRSFSDIYLHSNMATGFGPVGSYKMVKLYIGIALFVLLMASFNFINLTTVRSMDRAREIGVQKLLGNVRSRLIGQFLMETGLLCVFALIISLLLMISLLPAFNDIADKNFTLPLLLAPANLLIILGVLVVLIPLAGFYPALVLSGYEPIQVLKGKFSHSVSGTLLRKVLVTFQIVLSVSFMISILVIWKQISFMRQQDLGFEKENIMLVDLQKLPWGLRHQQATAAKNALLSISGVTHVTSSNAVPGVSGWDGQFAYPEGMQKDKGVSIEFIPADADYIKTIGLSIVAGRDFIKGNEADVKGGFIINESAARVFGWGSAQNAIGKKLSTSGIEGTVVGVVKDYHQHGLQRKIGGLVLSPVEYINFFAIRYNGQNFKGLSTQVQQALNPFYGGYTMENRWMNEFFEQQYNREEKFRQHIGIAAIVSVIICCLGLLGLSVYTARQKSKEVSIRKVLGASVSGLVVYLSRELLLLSLVAMTIAIPLTWWVMQQWLTNFAYRTPMNWWLFAMAGGIVLFITLFTISFQAIKTAIANPVKSLRTE